MQWFRLYHEFAHDPKVQVMAFEDQRHLMMLMCMHSEGHINEHTTDDEVACYLRVSCNVAETLRTVTLRRFMVANTWQLARWEARQFRSDNVTDRVRKHRENKKKTGCNVTVTAPDTDSEQNRADNIPDAAEPSGSPKSTFRAYAKLPKREGKRQYPWEFEQVWETYPRRAEDAKSDCYTLCRKAVADGVNVDDIISGSFRWKDYRGGEFAIGLRRWLRDHMWEQPPPATPSTVTPLRKPSRQIDFEARKREYEADLRRLVGDE